MRTPGGVIVLTSHGHSTRLIPLLDVVAPDDDPTAVADRWGSLAGAVEVSSVVLYLAASGAIRALPLSLATSMLSVGLTLLVPALSWQVSLSRCLRRPALSGLGEPSPSLCRRLR
jgi:hypothetical protein